MLLSSLSFVKNCQFSDYIISKIKEDQDKRDTIETKKLININASRKSVNVRKTDSTVIYKKIPSIKQAERSAKDIIETGIECRQLDRTLKSPKRPTFFRIETMDGFVVDTDIRENILFLAKGECSQFQKITISQTDKENLKVEAFQLRADPSFFICYSGEKLRVRKFDDPITEDDNRCFIVDENSAGLSCLRPLGKRGFFWHHMDEELSVRKLDVNWRPPEEYLFHVRVVVEADNYGSSDDITPSTLRKSNMVQTAATNYNGKESRKRFSLMLAISKWRKWKTNRSKVKIQR